MRILHTSDWHLGRTLKGVDLTEAHRVVLDRITEIVDEHQVDAVVIAGDVYDRAIPPTDAVKLLEYALAQLCARVPVILTPGNHDSAVRLGFGAALFTDRLHIRAGLSSAHEPVTLSDEHGEVHFYGVPFLDAEEVRQFARETDGLEIARTQAESAKYVLGRVRADLAERAGDRSVVIAHAFVIDAEATPLAEATKDAMPAGVSGASSALTELGSESERDITAGGLDFVPTASFDGFSYVALGHLHGPQNRKATTSGTVVEYSGSPLRFSFSERNHRKGVTLVDIDADGSVHTKRIELPQPRGMAKLIGTMAEFLQAAQTPSAGPFADHVDDWVDITVTDERRPEEMRTQLLRVFPHMLSHRHLPTGLASSTTELGASLPSAATPIEIMTSFVEEVSGTQLHDDEREVLQKAVTAVFGEGN